MQSGNFKKTYVKMLTSMERGTLTLPAFYRGTEPFYVLNFCAGNIFIQKGGIQK